MLLFFEAAVEHAELSQRSALKARQPSSWERWVERGSGGVLWRLRASTWLGLSQPGYRSASDDVVGYVAWLTISARDSFQQVGLHHARPMAPTDRFGCKERTLDQGVC